MRFITSVFALGALVAAVFGADNPIIKPDGKEAIVAGKPCVVTWTPTTGPDSMVTLTLRKGPSTDLQNVAVIVGPIKNTGSYTWNVASDLPSADNYAIMITSPAAPQPNYTPLLSIQGSSSKPEPSPTSSSTPSSSVYPAVHPKVHPAVYPEVHHSTNTKPTGTGYYPPYQTGTGYHHSGNSTYGYGQKNSTSTKPSPSSTPSSYGSKSSSVPAPASGAMGTIIFSPTVLVACFIGAFMLVN